MKKLKSKEGSLYMVFMKGFILLFLVIVGLAGILYGVNYFLPRRVVVMPKSYDIADYTNILEEEKYDRVPVTKTFGKTGYLEILDENAKVIYDSRGKTNKKYHKDSLRYISEIYPDVYYGVQRIGSGYQLKKSGYLIFQYRWNDESEQYLSGTALLDSKRNVIYSNINLGKKQLTKDEIRYLIESNDGEDVSGNILQKFPFTTLDGKARTALIHTESVGMQLGKIYSKIFFISLLVFVLAVIVTILLMDLYIVNKVRRPLADLEHAIARFREGERSPIVDYSGPREVTTVIDAFNQLEEKLVEAEEKQQALRNQKQQMLSGISHDLKTPITVIRGYVDAIRDGLVPPEDRDRYLAIIEERVDTMTNLISSLSDFSMLEHPDFRLYHDGGKSGGVPAGIHRRQISGIEYSRVFHGSGHSGGEHSNRLRPSSAESGVGEHHQQFGQIHAEGHHPVRPSDEIRRRKKHHHPYRRQRSGHSGADEVGAAGPLRGSGAVPEQRSGDRSGSERGSANCRSPRRCDFHFE